jgi:hypothetical protein
LVAIEWLGRTQHPNARHLIIRHQQSADTQDMGQSEKEDDFESLAGLFVRSFESALL